MATPDDLVVADLHDLVSPVPDDLLGWPELDGKLTKRATARNATAIGGCVVLIAAIVIGSVSLTGGGKTTPPIAPPSTTNGPLVVSQHNPTPENQYNGDLTLVDPQNGQAEPLISDSVLESGGAVSPDGNRYAFLSRTATRIAPGEYRQHDVVHVFSPADRDNKALFRCTNTCSGLTWSPDGSELAVADQNVGIDVIGLDGGSHRVCGSICANDLEQPVWSPDGKQIAFVQNQTFGDDNQVGAELHLTGSIWVVGEGGSGLHKVTGQSCSATSLTACTLDSAPTWSPDGTSIAFSRSDAETELVGSHGPSPSPSNGGLDVMNPDGTGVHSIYRCGKGSCAAIRAHWSPDGTRLAFVVSAPSGFLIAGRGRVVVIAATGGTPAVIQSPAHHKNYNLEAVAWSPDGTRLAMLVGHSYHSRVFTVSPDGADVREVIVPRVSGYDGATFVWAPQASS